MEGTPWRKLHRHQRIARKAEHLHQPQFPENGLSELKVVEEAVANFAASCVCKLREQKSRCHQLIVFAYTSRFRNDVLNHGGNRTVSLPMPTNDQLDLVAEAVQALRTEWREDGKYLYKKAGVIVWDISPDTAVQTVLFDPIDLVKQARLSAAIDAINRRNGFNTVKSGNPRNGQTLAHEMRTQVSPILHKPQRSHQGQSLNSILLPSKKERLVQLAKWFTPFLVLYIQEYSKLTS